MNKLFDYGESSLLKRQPQNNSLVFDAGKADETLELLGLTAPVDDAGGAMRLAARSAFGNSPYLAALAKRYPQQTCAMLDGNPDDHFASIIAALKEPRGASENEEEFMSFLRSQKNLTALLIALADIAGIWSLDVVTTNLSLLARVCLDLAVARALRSRMRAGDLPWTEGVNELSDVSFIANANCGYFLLGMGKLGGCELNYSSDIDLIALYDPARARYQGRKSVSDCFVKLTQDVVRYIDQRTMDGYVFRVDLRLRPDPGATPVALSVDAALGYYHSVAANWERSAMIKASFASGDNVAADQYLEEMSSWVWRRNMDFEALRDIASIKNQINRHYSVEDAHFRGYDVKLGIGGIREIEFFAQVNQLLHGGRNPSLRLKDTISTLGELVKLDLIPEATCSELTEAYQYLRHVEHRIQMTNDEQTHTVPDDNGGVARLAYFMGYQSEAAFEQVLRGHNDKVRSHYDQLLPGVVDENPSLTEGQTRAKLENSGFRDPDAAFATIAAWKFGRYRSLKTNRARDLLEQCLPDLLAAFSTTHSPDAALTRFDTFLSQLPAGVQLFSLLQSNPSLLGLLARIIGLAPALSTILAKATGLWDTVLSAQFFAPLESADSLRAQLKTQLSTARDYQDQLDFVRRFYAEQKFRTGVLMLEGVATAAEIGTSLSVVTDVILQELIPTVELDFAVKHGGFDNENHGIAVLALGKYGGAELTHTSDIDIIFLYESAGEGVYSNGKKPLFSNVYYTRLAQHIVTAITALTPEGRLFEVDTRLRPSGNQGPLAVMVSTFEDYYRSGAWSWEFLALTRARVILGPEKLVPKIQKAITAAIIRGPSCVDLASEAISMREKLRQQFGTPNLWDVKHTRGGLVDIEFICQFLTLKHAKVRPKIIRPNTPDSLEILHASGYLSLNDFKCLLEGYELQRTIQSQLRLCLDSLPKQDGDIPPGLQQILIDSADCASFTQLKKHMLDMQHRCHKLFERLITNG